MHVDTNQASRRAWRRRTRRHDAPDLRVFVFALFFIFGGITSLNDVIIPKLKELFTLNYTRGDAGAVLLLRRLCADRHSRRGCSSSGSAICAARSPGW